MSRLICKMLPLVISLFFACSINAATLAHLYEVSVPVYSQSTAGRKEAITQAFEELLVRITGKRDVLGTVEGQRLLKKSRQFVGSFRYEALPPPPVFEQEASRPLYRDLFETPVPEIIEPDDNPVEPDIVLPSEQIIVLFDEQAVKNSLWQHALPVWGKTRPTTLVWLATEDDEQRMVLDASHPSDVLKLFNEQSIKRGIPLLYPSLDAIDQSAINVTDILGSYKTSVENASSRYQVEAIISASFLFDAVEGWQTHWNLYQAGDRVNWRVAATDLDVAIFEGVDKLASILADRYAQTSTTNDSGRFFMTVQDVSNLGDYDKISRYLAAVSAIKHAELIQVKSNELVYELELRSSLQVLKRAIDLGRVLANQDDPFADEIDTHRLNYRFIP